MTRAVVAALAALALLAVAGLAASPAASRGELEVRHYSAKQSSADLASFFDSLPGTNSHSVLPNARHEHAKHRAQIQKAMHSKAQTAKHSNSKVTETKKIGDDGLPVEFRKKTAAQEAYDKEHQENAQKLRDYKRQNPDFKEKMDKVHKDWLAKHDNLPKSKAEKKEYAKLVAKEVGSVSKIVLSGLGYNTPKPKETQKDTQEEKERAKIIAEMRNDDAKFHDQAEAEFLKTHKSEVVVPASVTHRARAPLLH